MGNDNSKGITTAAAISVAAVATVSAYYYFSSTALGLSSSESAEPDLLPFPDEIVQNYEILGKIGEGVSAIVVSAVRKKDSRDAAIKIIDLRDAHINRKTVWFDALTEFVFHSRK
jgi:hypothetical protein